MSSEPRAASADEEAQAPDGHSLSETSRRAVQHTAADGDRAKAEHGIEDVVPGWEIDTPRGLCFVREMRVDLLSRHGSMVLADVTQTSLASLGRVCRTQVSQGEGWDRVCFFDTETGGLGTGAGNFIFLFGFGYLDGDEFCVRQYFLRDHTEEPAILASISEFLRDFDVVVSFNGRTFDWPLLQSRCTLNRCALPQEIRHLDLIGPARRLWRRMLQNCRLGTIEREILAVERINDVPGKLAPELYYAYRTDGDARPLADVFKHNAWDILSLATLARVIGDRLDSFEERELRPEELFGLASWYAEWNMAEESRACLVRAAAASESANTVWLHREARWKLSIRHKRDGEWEAALALWESLVAEPSGWRVAPCVELAKYHEHIGRDFHLALSYVDSALATVRERRHLLRQGQPLPEEQELLRRRARIERKLLRTRDDLV